MLREGLVQGEAVLHKVTVQLGTAPAKSGQVLGKRWGPDKRGEQPGGRHMRSRAALRQPEGRGRMRSCSRLIPLAGLHWSSLDIV